MSDTAAGSTARGMTLMVLAMLAIPVVDGLAKYLSASYSPLFISWARYAAATLIVLPAAAAIHGWRLFPERRLGTHVWRTAFLVGAMTLYFLAIARVPLVMAASAFLIGPVIGVLLSILFLGERMTRRKGAGLALGIVGSLVILHPTGAFDPGILLAFGAGLLFALYLVATRLTAQDGDPMKTLALQYVIGTILLTPQAILTAKLPATDVLLFLLGLGLFSALGHFLTIAAFRRAEASTLAPLTYVELIGAAIVGYVAFAEVPGAATVAGAGLIVISGLVLSAKRRSRRDDAARRNAPGET